MQAIVSSIKLFAADFDDTLVFHGAPSSWELLDKNLGCEEEDIVLNQAYHSGKFDMATWSQKTTELYRKYGLTYQKFRKIFLENMKLAPGAHILYLGLRAKGIKNAVVSGTIKNVYNIFVEKYGLSADYVKIAHEFHFDEDGKLVGGEFTNFDYEGKIDALQEICEKLSINLQQCAYVGNGLNDIPLFKVVGLPIAFNAQKPEVRKAAKIVVDGDDISRILQYL